MKNFLKYLSEVQKTYEFRIKIANCNPADKLDGLKVGLAKYAVESVSTAKRLPIKANDIDFPNIGTAFLFTAIASNTPSTNIIGWDQLIKFSNPIISFEHSGFLYLWYASSNVLATKKFS